MLPSGFGKSLDKGGLCDTLMNATLSMMERRLKIIYGRYVAANGGTIKGPKFRRFL